MSAKIKYTDEDLGEFQVIPDFLPSPEELAFKEETVKVTIALSKGSVEYFKREAKKHKTQYQKMIRRLLDVYASSQQQPPTRRLDAVTKRTATEVERSGSSAGLAKAARRLRDSGKSQKVLQVPQTDMAKAAGAMRKAGVSGTVKNMSGTKRQSISKPTKRR